ncbi:MAG: deoxyribodipyrimidine photo-lyase, partial [Pseudomonadota bacterium]
LIDPWVLKTGAGGPFKVFTPFWRALSKGETPPPVPSPGRIDGVNAASDDLADWALSAGLGSAKGQLANRIDAGEGAANDRLHAFLEGRSTRYAKDRDRLDVAGTTGLSDALAVGEISPRQIWATMDRYSGDRGVEAARRQLVWRDFAHHILFHDPEMERENWRREWSAFPWRDDNADAEKWRWGRTGVEVIDAAMRELWVTGRMHNRARMLVGSYLTKNLLTHWRIGESWFRDTLIDWDPANNAMGWQWVAGCGPDAAPYFRIFNPETQAEKFDPAGVYRNYWLRGEGAEDFRSMLPRHVISVLESPPLMVDLKATRQRALSAWEAMRSGAAGKIEEYA